ncbi:proton-associated sugar transporter A-like [Toxorhynchites rutilus septentrionalis]|uniref:proton-associated sugar transporter A-like n=1 Tax=Toxorhynchites rutilus septentrionalis TaxID=329112 RepID=UPI00247AA8FB|nr:proton-associated sugar transporter A-like [Toxorhynchites rutilus septentrionalis]
MEQAFGVRNSVPAVPGFHQLSDAAIMEGMLQARHDHAKQQDKDYSHLFRRKTRWEMIRLSLYQVGVEFCYAAETAFVSPIVLANGLSHTYMTMVWAFAPMLGFFLAPMVASLSDQIRSRWGRRRPILLALASAVITGLLILPHGKTIGLLLGDEDVPVDQMSGFRWGILVTVIALVLTDFDVETSSGVARTYFMDVCVLDDHTRILTMAMVIGGIGGTVGYLLGGVNWLQTDIGSAIGSNEATVFAAVVIVLLLGMLSTVTSFREVSLPQLEKDEMLRPITKAMFEAEKCKQLSVYNISNVVKNGDKHEPASIAIETSLTDQELTFVHFFKNLLHMPRSLLILYLTQLLSHLGFLSYCLYFTDFVGNAVFGGDVTAPEGSSELAVYEEGVRFGSLGMALFTISTTIYSIFIEKITLKFSTRAVHIGGLLIYSAGMLLMALFNEKWMVFLCCPAVGIMYATIYTVPFLVISRYHVKNSFAMKDGACIESDQKRGFGADVSMLSSMLFLAQLIVAFAIGSVIDALGTTTVVIYSASIFSFFAAIAASQVLHMEN